MMDVVVNIGTYLCLQFCGFPTEPTVREVEDREVDALEIPLGVCAFYFFDLISGTVDGVPVSSEELNRSKTYIVGFLYTLDEVRELPGMETLVEIAGDNLNEGDGLILSPSGEWFAFEPDCHEAWAHEVRVPD